jgi:hypothetical protein
MCVKGVARSGNRFLVSSPSIDWRLKAACREHPPELWESGGYEQLPLLAVAEQICYDCPVMLECEAHATKADLQYSMRAGRMPSLQPLRSPGRPAHEGRSSVGSEPCKAGRTSMLDRGECSQGHVIASPEDLSSAKRCRICERAAGAEIRRRKGIPERAPRTHCSRGHEFTEENTYRPPANPSNRQCRTCDRARRKSGGAANIPV